MTEGSIFFEGQGEVQGALRRITSRLNGLGIPYAVVGGMALFQYGVRRFTEDVDILVTRESLKLIHERLEGLGYVPPFSGSKNLRDVVAGVKIEFLITGAYPGDGKEKPVAFPDPATVSVLRDGIEYLNLESLVELKLASGMTGAGRQKDLGDVVALMKELSLPLDFADRLNDYVRSAYRELWREAQKRYVRRWPKALLDLDIASHENIPAGRASAARELEAMKADGVVIDPGSGEGDDDVLLVTTDPEIAGKYDMHDEEEYWDEALEMKTNDGSKGQE